MGRVRKGADVTTREKTPLTKAGFEAALQALGATPAKPDDEAAYTIATFLDGCCALLRDAEADRLGSESDATG